MRDLLSTGLKFYAYTDQPYIPVEFADAAYRFGHSQDGSVYTLNSGGAKGQVFPDCAGSCPVPHDRTVDWAYFFHVDNKRLPQASKRIDTLLAHSLIDLPTSVVGNTEIPEQHSLAYRDLVRGEAIARVMGVEPLSQDEVGGRIVAEVLLGLIDGDPNSYRNAPAEWRPELPSSQAGHFVMADLLRYAVEA